MEAVLNTRTLGATGPLVSTIGLGCMGMTARPGLATPYGAIDTREAFATIQEATDLGVTLFDTAEMYGPYLNEQMLGRALRGRRDRAIISTKFGFAIENGRIVGVDSKPSNVRASADASLVRLGVDVIDILFQHRLDPTVPIEEAVGAMSDLVRAGKVRFLGLCEVSSATLRRAQGIHTISALQAEYSLWERTLELDILATCRDLGIGIMAYAPLGRGFLTAHAQRADAYSKEDYRHYDPRYQDGNFEANCAMLDTLVSISRELDATPAQVALSWLLARGPDIVPIPGCKTRWKLRENVGALALALQAPSIDRLNLAFGIGVTAGARYASPEVMAALRR